MILDDDNDDGTDEVECNAMESIVLRQNVHL